MQGFTFAATALAALLSASAPSDAGIPTCDIHNGMKIWYLDYAADDYTSSHPLGVREGVVDINEKPWHQKCAKHGPNTKIFVPFNPISGADKGQMDTRWQMDVYRTRAEAERAYRRLR